VQGVDEDTCNVEEEYEAVEVQDNEEDASNNEEYEAEEDADDNGDELLGLVADTPTTQDDMMPEDMHGNEANVHGANVETGIKTEIHLEGYDNKADELAACNAAEEDTRAAEEVPLSSEVTKARMEEYDSESTLSR